MNMTTKQMLFLDSKNSVHSFRHVFEYVCLRCIQ